MDEVKTAELRHYASPYYDPVKAHEYYMRTRELKGRSTSSLNDEGKKVWSYTKNNIKSEKAAKVKEEQLSGTINIPKKDQAPHYLLGIGGDYRDTATPSIQNPFIGKDCIR